MTTEAKLERKVQRLGAQISALTVKSSLLENELLASRAILSWLERNARKELHIRSDEGRTVIKRWHRPYITSYDFEGCTVRQAIEDAITKGT